MSEVLTLSLTKFFDRMSRTIPSSGVPIRNSEALSQLDPDRIDTENVRSVLGVSHREALRICEIAVRQGLFEKRIAVFCPDGTVAVTAKTEADIPSVIRCWTDIDGHKEAIDVPAEKLERFVFYRLTVDE